MTKEDWVHSVGHSPVCQILSQMVVRVVITSCPPAWTSSAGTFVDSSWLPFLQWLYCSLHFSAKNRVVILCVCLGTVQYWWISIGLLVVQLRAVFCPLIQYVSLFCKALSWTIWDSSRFPLFHSGQVFHQLVCPLTVVLPQIVFNLATLFSYSVFFSLFRAPLDVVVHFLVFLRSFRLKFFLSHFSSFFHADQEFLQWPRFFFFWRCLPRISLAVSVTAVFKVVIIESMSVSLLLMMVRGANLPPIIAWNCLLYTSDAADD